MNVNVQGLDSRVLGSGRGVESRVHSPGSMVSQGLGAEFSIQGLGYNIKASGCQVHACPAVWRLGDGVPQVDATKQAPQTKKRVLGSGILVNDSEGCGSPYP